MFRETLNAKLRFYITGIIILIGLNAFAQRQDSTYHEIFHLSQAAQLNINISYADLIISPSIDDSVRIEQYISLIPSNIETPFNGIETTIIQKDSSTVKVNLMINSNIQPSNELQAQCYISLPRNTNIKLKGRYSHIDLASPFGKTDFNIEYSTLNAVALEASQWHKISGSYSELYIEYIESKLSLEGTNLLLESNKIKQLDSKLQFSTIKAKQLGSLNANSYSDKFLISEADSVIIKGEYSSLKLDHIKNFFQCELSYGALIVGQIMPSVSELNIANKYVTSKLTYSANSTFSINADMRYCKLSSAGIKYEKIASPSGTLFKGHYGNQENETSTFSIVSSFGDVSLEKH